MSFRPVVVAALAAALFVALPTAGASAVSGNGKCKVSKRWGLVKRTPAVVVFLVERSDQSQTLFACLKTNGKRARLADSYDDNFVTSITFDLVQANGRFIAWQWTSTDQSCKADCPPGYEPTTYSIERVNMGTRKTLRWEGKAEGSALRLSKKGNVAWISATTTANVFEVRTGDSAGHRAIDSGAIDTTSLNLRGTTLSWMNAGQPKTATLP